MKPKLRMSRKQINDLVSHETGLSLNETDLIVDQMISERTIIDALVSKFGDSATETFKRALIDLICDQIGIKGNSFLGEVIKEYFVALPISKIRNLFEDPEYGSAEMVIRPLVDSLAFACINRVVRIAAKGLSKTISNSLSDVPGDNTSATGSLARQLFGIDDDPTLQKAFSAFFTETATRELVDVVFPEETRQDVTEVIVDFILDPESTLKDLVGVKGAGKIVKGLGSDIVDQASDIVTFDFLR